MDAADALFPGPSGTWRDPRRDWADWKELLSKAGVRDARLHDARHTTATMMLEQRISSLVVMEWFGWSSVALTQRYQHVTNPLKKEAARLVGEAIWGAETG